MEDYDADTIDEDDEIGDDDDDDDEESIVEDNNNDNNNDDDDLNIIEDKLLDDALKEKRSKQQRLNKCVVVMSLLRRRMELTPVLRYLDAVRMIGLSSDPLSSHLLTSEEEEEEKTNGDDYDRDRDRDEHHHHHFQEEEEIKEEEEEFKIDEIEHHGLFETTTTTTTMNTNTNEAAAAATPPPTTTTIDDGDNHDFDDEQQQQQQQQCQRRQQLEQHNGPSKKALELGREVQQLLLRYNYTYENCRDEYLLPSLLPSMKMSRRSTMAKKVPYQRQHSQQLHEQHHQQSNNNCHDHDHDHDHNTNHNHNHRMFSGQSFFAHRHDLFKTTTCALLSTRRRRRRRRTGGEWYNQQQQQQQQNNDSDSDNGSDDKRNDDRRGHGHKNDEKFAFDFDFDGVSSPKPSIPPSIPPLPPTTTTTTTTTASSPPPPPTTTTATTITTNTTTKVLDVLVWLFLFGLGLELSTVVDILGPDNYKLLKDANLLTTFWVLDNDNVNNDSDNENENDTESHKNNNDKDDEDEDDNDISDTKKAGTASLSISSTRITKTYIVVGKFQIYPIDIEMFLPSSSSSASSSSSSSSSPRQRQRRRRRPTSYYDHHHQQQQQQHIDVVDDDERHRHLFIMTDWPMESLRSTQNAIMSIGYDTLELLVLTGSAMTSASFFATAAADVPLMSPATVEEEDDDEDVKTNHRSMVSDTYHHPEDDLYEEGQQSHITTDSVDSTNDTSYFDVLDLCCGCGIQGIFVWKVWNYYYCRNDVEGKKHHKGNEERRKKIKIKDLLLHMSFSDLNPRAMNFITANIALNGLVQDSHNDDEGQQQRQPPNPRYQLFCGNLFEPIDASREATSHIHDCKPQQFDWILCNPPFVAVPPADETATTHHDSTIDNTVDQDPASSSSSSSNAGVYPTPALFAVGGGVDGMDLLRKIMKEVPRHMKTMINRTIQEQNHQHNSPNMSSLHHPRLFMVTEVPNVDQSCRMIQRMLSPNKKDGSTSTSNASHNTNNVDDARINNCEIRVAYVEEDVETVEEYCKERQEEAGLPPTIVSAGDDLNNMGDVHQDQQQKQQHLQQLAATPSSSPSPATPTTFYGYHDWSKPMRLDGIYNRALVLITITFLPSSSMSSFSRIDTLQAEKYETEVNAEVNKKTFTVRDPHDATTTTTTTAAATAIVNDTNNNNNSPSSMFLFAYSSRSNKNDDDDDDENENENNNSTTTPKMTTVQELEVDEEDEFLTPDGMEFIRRSFCLYHHHSF